MSTKPAIKQVKDKFQSGEEKIFASNKGFDESDGVEIADMIRENPETKKLWLGNNNISDNGFIAILDAMKDNTHLELLRVDNNNITDIGGMAFVDFLKTNHPSLKEVSLSFNQLTDESAIAIAKAFPFNETLKEFWLYDNNDITEKGKAALKPFGDFFTGVHGTVTHPDPKEHSQSQVSSITINVTDLNNETRNLTINTDITYSDLCDAISTLTSTEINDNVILTFLHGEEHLHLSDQSTLSNAMDLLTNGEIPSLSIIIMRALKKVKDQFQSGKEEVWANNKGFGESDGVEIADMIRENPETKKLWLGNNNISDNGFIAILEAMKDNTNLEWLGVGNNNITDIGGMAFADFLKTNHPSLKIVSLDNNHLTDVSAIAIAQAFLSSVTLEKFNLRGNDGITEQGKAALEPFGDFFQLAWGTVTHPKQESQDIIIDLTDHITINITDLNNKTTSLPINPEITYTDLCTAISNHKDTPIPPGSLTFDHNGIQKPLADQSDLELAMLALNAKHISSLSITINTPQPFSQTLLIPYKDLIVEDQAIGRGATSTVYQGTWRDEPVAIKEFTLIGDSTFSKTLINEVNLLQLQHDNLIQLRGVSIDEPHHQCIVMEYANGGSLSDVISKSGKQELGVVIQFALGIAKGMNFLHHHNVIHRDLKPENVLLSSEGSVRITDFGISKTVEHTKTNTGGKGTWQYMAPEVMLGGRTTTSSTRRRRAKNNTSSSSSGSSSSSSESSTKKQTAKYGSSVDVYSFAMVIWALLFGEPPFSDMTESDLIIEFHKDRDFREEIFEEWNEELSDLITRCWATDPSSRPSFAEIITELQELQASLDQGDEPIAELKAMMQQLLFNTDTIIEMNE